jgi:hypothetical protein
MTSSGTGVSAYSRSEPRSLRSVLTTSKVLMVGMSGEAHVWSRLEGGELETDEPLAACTRAAVAAAERSHLKSPISYQLQLHRQRGYGQWERSSSRGVLCGRHEITDQTVMTSSRPVQQITGQILPW